MKSTLKVIDKLYNEFIDRKNRFLMLNVLDEEILCTYELETGNAVMSISCTNVFSNEYTLYLDLISLLKLGYKNIDWDKVFDKVVIIIDYLKFDDNQRNYILNKFDKCDESFVLSLKSLLDIEFSAILFNENIKIISRVLNSWISDISYSISLIINEDEHDLNLYIRKNIIPNEYLGMLR